MKKILLLFTFFTVSYANAQELFRKISENYYRSAPFNREFSQFLNHLMNDPSLANKTIHKKTDSTLFFLEADYASHNPFFFKTSRTKIILAEKDEVLKDSIEFMQTVYEYQLIGYAPPGEEGIRDVQQEFDKFCRKYRKGFDGDNYKEIKNEGIESGEIRDYSFTRLTFYPLTVAWATSRDHSQNIFALTIRFMVYNNRAFLPIPANRF